MLEYEKLSMELNEEELKILENKMNYLKKELTDLSCLAIKLSIKIMSKLIKYITEESINEKLEIKMINSQGDGLNKSFENSEGKLEIYNSQFNILNNLLNKTKIFLKITRLIIDNAKYNVYAKSEKSKEFFQM